MRDKDRIPGILAELQKTWEKVPDLRLMQLLMGITFSDGDSFYIEDDTLVGRIQEFNTSGYTQGRLL